MSSCDNLAPPADRVLVAGNPCAGSQFRRDAIGELVTAIERRGFTVDLVTDLEAVAHLAARYRTAGGLRAIVAAGGDGTVAEIVNRTESDTPITVFPLGTANLLAGYLGIKRNAAAMADMLCDGAILRLDAARANGRIFLLMAGCGFDADVVHRLHRRRQGRHITYWTWAQPILQSIRDYRYPPLRVYCDAPDGTTTELAHRGRWAFVVNLPVYAGGLRVAPQAVGTDGLLDVCTFADGSLWHGLRYLGFVLLGRHHKLAGFRRAATTRVRIESDEPVPYQLDGDPGGMLPLEIDVLPGRVTLLAPRAAAAELAPGAWEPQRTEV